EVAVLLDDEGALDRGGAGEVLPGTLGAANDRVVDDRVHGDRRLAAAGGGRQWPPWGDASKLTRIRGAAAAALNSSRSLGGRSGSKWPSASASLISKGTSATHSGWVSPSKAAAWALASIWAL